MKINILTVLTPVAQPWGARRRRGPATEGDGRAKESTNGGIYHGLQGFRGRRAREPAAPPVGDAAAEEGDCSRDSGHPLLHKEAWPRRTEAVSCGRAALPPFRAKGLPVDSCKRRRIR
jgi:hypothetical protein